MATVNSITRDLIRKSLESTLHKLSKASKSVGEKNGNTSLVNKRRDAIRIGLESLESEWGNKDFDYPTDLLISAKDELQRMLCSVDSHLMRVKEGSAQKTLNERRHLALTQAITSLDARI
jgi:hypothetical protein